jgi:hypothetical protein
MGPNFEENIRLFWKELRKMRGKTVKYAACVMAALLLCIVGAGLTLAVAAPRSTACLDACKAQYDQDIQACIYYVDPTLTWGVCKQAATDKYRACKSYCQ